MSDSSHPSRVEMPETMPKRDERFTLDSYAVFGGGRCDGCDETIRVGQALYSDAENTIVCRSCALGWSE